MTVIIHTRKYMMERHIARLEKALKDALEVARHAFPQDVDGSIEPIDPSHHARMKLWNQYCKALRVSQKPFR